jgi:predicted nucleotidyltransferase
LLALHFNTDPRWVEAICDWAATDDRIDRVWISGSRATGRRTPKPNPPPVPDLDVGYVLTGSEDGERLGYAICMAARWRELLAQHITVPVDLQYAEPDHDERVWPCNH